jgi:hypothetical protein
MKEIEAVRFNHLKLSSRIDGHKDYFRDHINENNVHSGDFIMSETGGHSP